MTGRRKSSTGDQVFGKVRTEVDTAVHRMLWSDGPTNQGSVILEWLKVRAVRAR